MMTPSDYQNLWDTSKLTPDAKRLQALDYVCRVALTNQSTYQAVQNLTRIPWPLIAAIHFRESDQNFKCHLHNGDPLSARTVHVPKGRPATGEPPFTWMQSAADAFVGEWRPSDWSLPSCLEFMERFNGLGYQKHGINSPYLWDYTDKYVSGLYVADNKFDPHAKEDRPGCVAIIKSLIVKGVKLDALTALAPTNPNAH
jgi:lysozyme family protein